MIIFLSDTDLKKSSFVVLSLFGFIFKVLLDLIKSLEMFLPRSLELTVMIPSSQGVDTLSQLKPPGLPVLNWGWGGVS